MSRTTVHSYMEGFSGATLSSVTKDLYLNLTKPIVLADLLPWGSSHIQTNAAVDYVASAAATANTQTEYSYPTTNVPMEIIGLSVKYSTSASYITARNVKPFEAGDDCATAYTSQQKPVYFLRNNKIIIYPQYSAVVTNAIRVQMIARMTDISSTVTNTGLSAEGEKLWALKALESYYIAINDNKAISSKAQYEQMKWALEKVAPIGSANAV